MVRQYLWVAATVVRLANARFNTLPIPTIFAKTGSFDDPFGFTPKPTGPPMAAKSYFDNGLNLLRRQADSVYDICGYYDGGSSYYCNPGSTCASNTNFLGSYAVFGCCSGTECNFASTCHGYGSTGSIGLYSASCTNSVYPDCFLWTSVDSSGNTLGDFGCTDTTQLTIALTSFARGDPIVPFTTYSSSITSSSTTTSSSPSTTSFISPTPPVPIPSPQAKGLSTGAKAGIGAGVGVAALVALVVLGFCLKKRRASTSDPAPISHDTGPTQPVHQADQVMAAAPVFTPPPTYSKPYEGDQPGVQETWAQSNNKQPYTTQPGYEQPYQQPHQQPYQQPYATAAAPTPTYAMMPYASDAYNSDAPARHSIVQSSVSPVQAGPHEMPSPPIPGLSELSSQTEMFPQQNSTSTTSHGAHELPSHVPSPKGP